MTIRRRVSIACDAEPFCSAELVGGWSSMDLDDVRRRARAAGWQQSIDGDFCPEHRRSLPAMLASSRRIKRRPRDADTPAMRELSVWPTW